jgi:hypothetical protein
VLQNVGRFAFSEPAHIFAYRVSLKLVNPTQKSIGTQHKVEISLKCRIAIWNCLSRLQRRVTKKRTLLHVCLENRKSYLHYIRTG